MSDNRAPKFYVGQILKVRTPKKDFSYTGYPQLIAKCKEQVVNTEDILAEVVDSNTGYDDEHKCYSIRVKWIQLTGICEYSMLECEFEEFFTDEKKPEPKFTIGQEITLRNDIEAFALGGYKSSTFGDKQNVKGTVSSIYKDSYVKDKGYKIQVKWKDESYKYAMYEFEFQEYIDSIAHPIFGCITDKQPEYKSTVKWPSFLYDQDKPGYESGKIYMHGLPAIGIGKSYIDDWIKEKKAFKHDDFVIGGDAIDASSYSLFRKTLDEHGKPVISRIPEPIKNSDPDDMITRISQNLKSYIDRSNLMLDLEEVAIRKTQDHEVAGKSVVNGADVDLLMFLDL